MGSSGPRPHLLVPVLATAPEMIYFVAPPSPPPMHGRFLQIDSTLMFFFYARTLLAWNQLLRDIALSKSLSLFKEAICPFY